MIKRSSGILIHPTSFFGKYICGQLDYDAKKIIDWLKKAGQSILQVLPLGPTGYGDSPYQSFSAFAGTPYIISFDELIKKGILSKNDLADYPRGDFKRVSYYDLYINNFKILKKAFSNTKIANDLNYEKFCNENSYWLDDYATFMAIKDMHNGASWNLWEDELRERTNLSKFIKSHKFEINFYKFIQYEFYTQWMDFKTYANNNGIKVIGDAPIFVSYDSADVWANQKIFNLSEDENPAVVAGVPPDYFSETGQLWGNPIYRWDVMLKNNFDWWKKRINHTLKLVDCIRIDHFRGFEAYWEIPFGEKTAINGKWVKAPGFELFNSLKEIYGENLNELIIAEDLGVITDEVKFLRDYFKFPGMRIFEFANFPKFDAKDNDEAFKDGYLPENYIKNCIAYPGTHDNDTLLGWYESLDKQKKHDILHYLKIKDKNELNYAVIKKMLDSKADRIVFLMQDVLELPTESRLNKPGTCGIHNWSWKLEERLLTDSYAEKLYDLTKSSGRI